MTDYTHRCSNCLKPFIDKTKPPEHGQCPACGSMQIEKCTKTDKVLDDESVDIEYDITCNDATPDNIPIDDVRRSTHA